MSDDIDDDLDSEYTRYSEEVLHLLVLHQKQLGEMLLASVIAAGQAIAIALQRKEAMPYHTSILTGAGWVKELLSGHPERIRTELGVHKEVFSVLVAELQAAGYSHTRHVTIEEQLAIFLYTCVTGLTVRHVGERFQRSNSTISKYFKRMLHAFSSPEIYNRYVRLPRANDPIPEAITTNPRFMPYFKDAIGAIDGTHIPCMPSAEEREATRNRKGFHSQNCLICSSFDMRFTYVLSGWEGSAADASIYHDARTFDLTIPPGKYYLADAGFPSCPELLVPYRGERYHLAEWGRAQLQPANRREYFNLRHAQLRNVVERIIGVLKRRFRILIIPPEFSMDVQARIPPACCCIHNIIRTFDNLELDDMEPREIVESLPDEPVGIHGVTRGSVVTSVDRDAMAVERDQIALNMWLNYADERQRRGNPVLNQQGD